MFNAVFKIPMQFFILLLGVLIFVFYRFERPPVYFNRAAWEEQARHGSGERLRALEGEFAAAHDEERLDLRAWLDAHQDQVLVAVFLLLGFWLAGKSIYVLS